MNENDEDRKEETDEELYEKMIKDLPDWDPSKEFLHT